MRFPGGPDGQADLAAQRVGRRVSSHVGRSRINGTCPKADIWAPCRDGGYVAIAGIMRLVCRPPMGMKDCSSDCLALPEAPMYIRVLIVRLQCNGWGDDV